MQEERPEFWDLIAEHRAPLWRFSLALTRSRDAAKDLVSDTVLAAFRSYPKLRDTQAFQRSLFTIAVRLYRRQRWRRRIFTEPTEFEPLHERTDEAEYDLEQLMAALGRLPEKQREALVLFELSDFSIEEIQRIQGGSISGVKTRLARGRDTLREMLTETEQTVMIS